MVDVHISRTLRRTYVEASTYDVLSFAVYRTFLPLLHNIVLLMLLHGFFAYQVRSISEVNDVVSIARSVAAQRSRVTWRREDQVTTNLRLVAKRHRPHPSKPACLFVSLRSRSTLLAARNKDNVKEVIHYRRFSRRDRKRSETDGGTVRLGLWR
jgi:hypothetical protein